MKMRIVSRERQLKQGKRYGGRPKQELMNKKSCGLLAVVFLSEMTISRNC